MMNKDNQSFDLNLYEEQSEINRIILWDDTLLVYGSWNTLPN